MEKILPKVLPVFTFVWGFFCVAMANEANEAQSSGPTPNGLMAHNNVTNSGISSMINIGYVIAILQVLQLISSWALGIYKEKLKVEGESVQGQLSKTREEFDAFKESHDEEIARMNHQWESERSRFIQAAEDSKREADHRVNNHKATIQILKDEVDHYHVELAREREQAASLHLEHVKALAQVQATLGMSIESNRAISSKLPTVIDVDFDKDSVESYNTNSEATERENR